MRLALLASAIAVLAVAALAVIRHRETQHAVALPQCGKPEATIARPALLPSSLPFPAGTVFTKRVQNRMTHGVPAVEGRMPLDLEGATRFLNSELPRAGFALENVQQRQGREVVAYSEMEGTRVRFEAKALPACRGAMSILVSARQELFGRNLHAE